MRADRHECAAVQPATEPDGFPPPPLDTRHPVLVTALLAGVGLLWPLPLVGVVLMVAASFALAVSWEPELNGADLTPALVPPDRP